MVDRAGKPSYAPWDAPPGEHPAATAGLLGLFDELREHLTLAADRRQRIDAIEADRLAFHLSVDALPGSAGSGDSLADLRALTASLVAARQEAALARDHAAQAERAAKAWEGAESKQKAARDGASWPCCPQCGAGTAAEARQFLQQSAARRQAQGQLDMADQAILDAGAGMGLDALLAEAATLAPDDLPGLRDAADTEAGTAASQARRAAVQANELRRELDSAESSEDADTALAAQMAALSKAGTHGRGGAGAASGGPPCWTAR